MNWTDHLPAASATIQLGEHLGRLAQPGWVVSLEGPLGSGKTTLAQGLAAGLGVGERLTSPTFVLESQYRGRLLLRHFDLYRLGEAPSEEELIEIGLAEALTDEGVCLIEWADRLTKGALPDCLRVRLAHAQTGRSVEIAAADAAYKPVVKELLRERIGH